MSFTGRGRYTLLPAAHWDRAELRGLGSPPRLLYLFLYAHPRMTSIALLRGLREALEPEFIGMSGETKRATAAAWNCLAEANAIRYEPAGGGVLIVPARLEDDVPDNPNIVKSWSRIVAELPRSAMIEAYLREVAAQMKRRGPSFVDAFKPLISKEKSSRNGSTYRHMNGHTEGNTEGNGKGMSNHGETDGGTDGQIRIPYPDRKKESAKALPASGPRQRFGLVRDALISRGFEGAREDVAAILLKAKAWERAGLRFEELVAVLSNQQLEKAAEPFSYLLGILETRMTEATGKPRPKNRRRPLGVDNGIDAATLHLRAALEDVP